MTQNGECNTASQQRCCSINKTGYDSIPTSKSQGLKRLLKIMYFGKDCLKQSLTLFILAKIVLKNLLNTVVIELVV